MILTLPEILAGAVSPADTPEPPPDPAAEDADWFAAEIAYERSTDR